MSIQFSWSLRPRVQWDSCTNDDNCTIPNSATWIIYTGAMTDCRSELNLHADTCMVGDNTALLIQDYDQPV